MPNNSLNQFVENPDAPPLRSALEDKKVAELKELLALLPGKQSLSKKADVIQCIEGFLLGSYPVTLWDLFDDLQKLAVMEAVHNFNGVYYQERFEAKYGASPDFTVTVKVRYGMKSSPGILRLVFIGGGRYSDEGPQIPSDMLPQLLEFVPLPEVRPLKGSKELPENKQDFEVVRRDTEQASLHDLHSVMSMVLQNKISVSNKTYMPSKTTINNISKILRHGDYYNVDATDRWGDPLEPVKGFAWPMLLQAAKLTQLNGSKLGLTKAGIKALSAAPADTNKLIWEKWRNTKFLDEFSRIKAIKGQKRKSRNSMTPVEDRRKTIYRALSACPVGEWLAFREFSRFMLAEGYSFDVTDYPPDLYLVDPEYGSLRYSSIHYWHILQQRYLSCLLFEYAATLGLIDVAYTKPDEVDRDFDDLWGADELGFLSRYDGLLYFRLTDLGAYCLGLTKEYLAKQPESKARLSVLPNLRVEASGELDFGHVNLLQLYADKVAENQWRLNAERMISAVESGHDIAELLTFLSQGDEQLLPESVEGLISKVKRQASSLKVKGTAMLVECVDAKTAQKVAENPETKKHCMLAGEKHLVITSTENTFRKALRKLGYGMPLV